MLTKLDKRILNRIQEDIPFKSRLWGAVAKELNIREGVLLKRIASLKKRGIIRRISAVLAPTKVNFVSTLAAVKTVPGNIDRVADEVNRYQEVTHNYKRRGEYDLWFTLVARNRARIDSIIRRISKDKGVGKITEFPTLKLFKINVKFTV